MGKYELSNMLTCCQCGKTYSDDTNFFKSSGGVYAYMGHLPVCKKCFEKQVAEFTTLYNSRKKAMQRVCMIYDLYFNEDLFASCDLDGDDDAFVGKYFRKLNLMQHQNKSFDTSLAEGFNFTSEYVGCKKVTPKTEDEEQPKINPEDIEKWGNGFDLEDYDILNNHYRLLASSNPQRDNNVEIFITDLCYIKMQQMKAVREGRVDDYSKLTESYRKTFMQAGLKAIKETNVTEDFTIGVNGETIEKYTPAEYYKNKQLFKDHDNIGDYIDRFLLRPLRNLMHGTKDRDKEYYVKDEEETDDFTNDE